MYVYYLINPFEIYIVICGINYSDEYVNYIVTIMIQIDSNIIVSFW